jgi:hypothetical protein
MNESRSPLRRIAALAAVVVVALALAGCTKKVTVVDAGYTAPEGSFSADARLIVYPDLAITVENWLDRLPEGPSEEDSLTSTDQLAVAPGTLHGVIVDGTPATAYQVLRREGNGGFAQLNDYLLTPTVRFLDSEWEIYTFHDARPSGFNPPSYVGRGVVSGEVTAQSPLTNLAEEAGSAVPALTYTGSTAPPDSNIPMSWDAVPGAVGYWIQIYQFRGGSQEQLLEAQPSPFVTSQARNFFVGYVAAPATSYQLGQPGALVLARKPLLRSVEYLVRITAVDANGNLLAYTYGDWEYLRAVGTYQRYRVGAVRVIPSL